MSKNKRHYPLLKMNDSTRSASDVVTPICAFPFEPLT